MASCWNAPATSPSCQVSEQGDCSVQDGAAQQAARLLDPSRASGCWMPAPPRRQDGPCWNASPPRPAWWRSTPTSSASSGCRRTWIASASRPE